MSTALVSAFYDINDVIQQSKQRPNSLDFRQRIDRKTAGAYIPRRHSTISTSSISPKGQLLGSNGTFYTLPSSPTEKAFNIANTRDRSLSASVQEEVEAQHRVNKRGSTNSTRYKTELCRPFEENGTCKYGDKCQFAHGIHELRNMSRHPKYKTELCRTYHTIGFCPYGPRCHFIHNDEEKRAPPTPNSHRSSSVSSLNSGPPSPILDPLPSPFPAPLTPPASPGYGGDVFVFGDDAGSLSNSPPQPSTPTSVSPTGVLQLSDSGSYSPPHQSEFGPLSPVAVGKTSPRRLPTPSPPPGIMEEDRSPTDFRVPSSPTDSINARRNGARLPIFSQIA